MYAYTDADYKVYMEMCIGLARNSHYTRIRPPFVGAVVVDNDSVIGSGYKKFLDETAITVHAERDAINHAADEITPHSVLVTTLEPCVRTSEGRRTMFGPCAEFIVSCGIKKVVFGLFDRSDHMQPGMGINYLRRHGVCIIQYRGLNPKITLDLMPRAFIRNYFAV